MDKPNYYAIIPANVRYDKNLKLLSRLLYAEITALSNKNGYCTATNKYFAELYEVTTTTISTCLSQLKDFGYIDIEFSYKEGTKEIANRYLKIFNDPFKFFCDTPLKNFNDPIKKNLKDNNTSSNNTSNNISNIIVEGQKFEENSENSFFLEMAKGLQTMVESKKRIKVGKIQLLNWTKEIKSLFSTISKIRGKEQALNDIKKAIQFLIDHSGEEYIPVVESGKTFKDKFSKIEDAIRRQKKRDFMRVDVNNLGW